ncbi:unnamed protein product, partial [Cuscuta epithymum]
MVLRAEKRSRGKRLKVIGLRRCDICWEKFVTGSSDIETEPPRHRRPIENNQVSSSVALPSSQTSSQVSSQSLAASHVSTSSSLSVSSSAHSQTASSSLLASRLSSQVSSESLSASHSALASSPAEDRPSQTSVLAYPHSSQTSSLSVVLSSQDELQSASPSTQVSSLSTQVPSLSRATFSSYLAPSPTYSLSWCQSTKPSRGVSVDCTSVEGNKALLSIDVDSASINPNLVINGFEIRRLCGVANALARIGQVSCEDELTSTNGLDSMYKLAIVFWNVIGIVKGCLGGKWQVCAEARHAALASSTALFRSASDAPTCRDLVICHGS